MRTIRLPHSVIPQPVLLSLQAEDAYPKTAASILKNLAHALLDTRTFMRALAGSAFVGFGAYLVVSLAIPHPMQHALSAAFPVVTPTLTQHGQVSAKGTLTFSLSTKDATYSYRLYQGNNYTDCVKTDVVVTCGLTPLGLAQSTAYTLNLQRYIHHYPAGLAATQHITSIEPITVVSSSIAAGTVLYTAPSEMSVVFSKPLLRAQAFQLERVDGNEHTVLATTVTVEDTTATIRFSEALPRSAQFELTLKDAEGKDHSFMDAPYVLAFRTSGGPAVKSISIGKYKVSATQPITLTFDVGLAAAQESNVSLLVNGQSQPAKITSTGNTITITPASSLPKCAAIGVRVASGLVSEFGIGGGSAWQYDARVLCQTVTSIGTSVQGRSITAYKFGTGSSVMLYVGATHGNETSSQRLLQNWVEALEANPSRIPSHRTIYVIPSLNPDGVAANTRLNAHGVDLNRNFPSNDWKAGVTMPDKSFLAAGGGSAPLSEPESAALASFIAAFAPRLVVTYHAKAGVVVPNDAGDSGVITKNYDTNSNLYFQPKSATSGLFEYDTTGAMEDWLYDKKSIPTLLVELWTMSGDEFAKNEKALWYTAGL